MHLLHSLLALSLVSAALAAAGDQGPLQTPAPTKVHISMDCYTDKGTTILRCDCTPCQPCDCKDPNCKDPKCNETKPPCDCKDPNCKDPKCEGTKTPCDCKDPDCKDPKCGETPPPCDCKDPDCKDPKCDKTQPPCKCGDPECHNPEECPSCDCDDEDCDDPKCGKKPEDPDCKKCPCPPGPKTVTVTKTVTVYPSSCSTGAPGGGGSGGDENCAPTSASTPLRRMWNGAWPDHFYATNGAEIFSAGGGGFVEEYPAGRVFLNQVPGTIPLYRCFYPPPASDHFYTANKAEFSKAAEHGCQTLASPPDGIIGYLYQKRICGAIPLYRLYNEATHDHFYTSNKQERDSVIASGGYKSEGITGYVLPA
ncbi:hypothetical protein NP233_g11714 [Leucocoprinus birnbaumii]|uniref:DUF5648 domain-containing protein n=1 Tax=Leucocoprinus birnbaumii TaxID=56174 RepID=A0AAD5VGY7_9AGAR|nr:hypothetical protein NP233_g11714 [Leucocoprinus birnbaumii]